MELSKFLMKFNLDVFLMVQWVISNIGAVMKWEL